MNNNPSPGNKAGGLTTILEKSLGAAAKGGTTTLRAVYDYAEPVNGQGLRLHGHARLRSRSAPPARSPAAANVICFTTGRGSAFGCKPTPSIKLATNNDVYRQHDRRHGHQLRRHPRRRRRSRRRARRSSTRCCAVASGEQTKSEELGYGDHEFVPWQIGAVM